MILETRPQAHAQARAQGWPIKLCLAVEHLLVHPRKARAQTRPTARVQPETQHSETTLRA